MIIEAELLAELRRYLQKVLDIHDKVPLDFTWREGGANASRILYHVGQSANFWLGDVILNRASGRDRPSEFDRDHTLVEIRLSIESALKLVDELERSDLKMEDPVSFHGAHKPSLPLEKWNVAKALIHVTAHTADHYGQMKIPRTED